MIQELANTTACKKKKKFKFCNVQVIEIYPRILISQWKYIELFD